MKKDLLAGVLVLTLLASLLAGCGSTAEHTKTTNVVDETATVSEQAAANTAEASAEETADDAPIAEDLTDQDRARDYTAHQALIKSLKTELPVTDQDVTLTYWLSFETATLEYIEGSDINNHQIWADIPALTGVNIDITMVDNANAQEKFNLMIASSDYTDLFNATMYTGGVEAAYDADIIQDLSDLIPEYSPNYWTLINSDQDVWKGVTSTSGKLLEYYRLKDQYANPTNRGAFIRQDWLDDLGMDVPQTYDELFDVLTAFKEEKGATEPLLMYNTILPTGGCMIGGFGSDAVLSDQAQGDAITGYYQIDGQVAYGAIQDGTRKYLSYCHKLCENGLINFDNMVARESNPFAAETQGYASNGQTGYFYNNQPFGGVYTSMSSDPNCNWWPVQDIAETAGQKIPFFEETSLIQGESLVITTACKNPEIAAAWCDYWYSYDGYLLANYGFEGKDWEFDDEGTPQYIPEVINEFENVNLAMCTITTQDAPGIYADLRLANAGDNPWTDREYACFDAWATNKDNSESIGSLCVFTTDESSEASAIYSDILTYVSTSALQFIRGDLDVDDDAVWDNYVSTIEGMNLDGLTSLVQGAYDRAYTA